MKQHLPFGISLTFALVSVLAVSAQNTCTSPHVLPIMSGQVCPGGISSVTVGQNFDPFGSSNTSPSPGCFYLNGYDDMWHRAIVPPDAGGMEIYFSGVGDCEVGGFFASCFTELEVAVYEGSNCNALSYYGCLEVAYGESLLGVPLFDGSGGLYVGGYPGDTLLFRTFEADDQNMSYTVDYVAALAPGAFCGFPIPLTGTGCNSGSFGAGFEPPDWASGVGCWFSNENTVFYSFEVDATTPQPVEITIFDISCVGGGSQLQMAIYDNDCNNVGGTGATYHGHTCGVGTVTLTATPNPLPIGQYLLVVDGDAGSECNWSFAGGVVLGAAYRYLDADFVEDRVLVSWETGQEQNNVGFFIDRSLDGSNWDEIAFIPGAMDSDSPVAYQYEDYELLGHRQYYRIRQLDLDGTEHPSFVVDAFIELGIHQSLAIQKVYPNPARSHLKLSFWLEKDAPISLRLLDQTARPVKNFAYIRPTQAGLQAIELDVQDIPAGIYVLELTSNGSLVQEKLTILR